MDTPTKEINMNRLRALVDHTYSNALLLQSDRHSVEELQFVILNNLWGLKMDLKLAGL